MQNEIPSPLIPVHCSFAKYTRHLQLWNQCSCLISKSPLQPTTPLDHTFEVRRLQYEIRRFIRQTAHLPQDDHDRIGWRDTLKKELDHWKALISSVALEDDESFNHCSQTMRKMYDYCLCVLFESELLTMDPSSLEALLRAAGEACISFRRIQNHSAMVYFTCSAVCLVALRAHPSPPPISLSRILADTRCSSRRSSGWDSSFWHASG